MNKKDNYNFSKLKEYFNKELENYDKELSRLICNTDILLTDKIKALQQINNKYKNILKTINNIYYLNKNIIAYRKEISKELKIFTIEYCKKYNIHIDYNSILEKYSLKKLYEELEVIRKKQNNLEALLNKTQEAYTLYGGYRVIEENIIEIKKDILNQYKEGLYSKEESERRFETKILLEFREYYRRLEIINNLKNISYKKKEIKTIIQLMEENITTDKKTFRSLEDKLKSYMEQKEIKNKKKEKKRRK